MLAETRNTDSRSSSSLFKYGRASRGRKYAFATFILSLVALLDFVEAQDCKYQFELNSNDFHRKTLQAIKLNSDL